MNQDITKQCPKCQRELPLEAYRKSKNRRYGVDSVCRKCRAEADASNRDRENARISRWRKGRSKKTSTNEETAARKMATRYFPKPKKCVMPKCKRIGERHHYAGATKEHAKDIMWLCRQCHAKAHLLMKARRRLGPAWM